MRRPAAWVLVFPALLAASCTGSLFQSKAPPPAVYVLSAGAASAPTAAAAELPVDLAVLRPRLRPGLESDRIAVLYPDRRLDYFADARWSGPLGDVLQDLAVQEFRAHGRLRNVSADTSVFPSAYWLEIDVTDFQADYASPGMAPTVRVRLRGRLGTSGDRRILGRFAAGAEQPAEQNRLSAIVEAYARAADTAMAQLVAQADDALAGSSEAR